MILVAHGDENHEVNLSTLKCWNRCPHIQCLLFKITKSSWTVPPSYLLLTDIGPCISVRSSASTTLTITIDKIVYPRNPLAETPTNTDAGDVSSESGSPKKKKRRKIAANHSKSGNSPKKFFAARARDEDNRRREGISDLKSSATRPTTPGHSEALEVPEIFVFENKKAYQRARTLFSLGYSSFSSASTREDLDVPPTLRWNELLSLLTSYPISCTLSTMKGTALKITRPARNGVPHGSVTLHKPHAGNPKVEREQLENMAGQLMQGFRWRKDHFVLAASPARAPLQPVVPEDEAVTEPETKTESTEEEEENEAEI